MKEFPIPEFQIPLNSPPSFVPAQKVKYYAIFIFLFLAHSEKKCIWSISSLENIIFIDFSPVDMMACFPITVYFRTSRCFCTSFCTLCLNKARLLERYFCLLPCTIFSFFCPHPSPTHFEWSCPQRDEWWRVKRFRLRVTPPVQNHDNNIMRLHCIYTAWLKTFITEPKRSGSFLGRHRLYISGQNLLAGSEPRDALRRRPRAPQCQNKNIWTSTHIVCRLY